LTGGDCVDAERRRNKHKAAKQILPFIVVCDVEAGAVVVDVFAAMQENIDSK
jgi:hypothetical protein